VDGHHPDAVAVLFQDRRFGRLRRVRGGAQLLDEAPERDAAAELVLPRQFRHVQQVGEGLFTADAQREADVRPRRPHQLVQDAGCAAPFAPGTAVGEYAVAMAMEPFEELQGAGDRTQLLDVRRRVAREHLGDAMRMEGVALEPLLRLAPEAIRPLEQVLVADREEGPAQRREH
jgi:hypothetical protein